MERIAVIDGIRTPFIKANTAFDNVTAVESGRIVTRELMDRTGIGAQEINQVIFGNVIQPPDAANISRVIALLAGLPKTIPSVTVHRNCASGLEAAAQAMVNIWGAQGDCYLVGGTESMSNAPFYFSKESQNLFTRLSRAKTLGQKLSVMLKFRPKHFSPKIGLQMGLTDPVCGLNMGQTAEVLVREFGISRKDQDEFALQSHQRAIASRDLLREEIVPVIPGPDFKDALRDDNGPREGQSMEALAKLKPIFDKTAGTVTAGNSSQITDGACALLVMKEERAKALGYQPLGYLREFAFVGVDPHRMGIGPAHAIPQVLKKASLTLKDMQAIEINEAFAAQVLSCMKALASETFAAQFGYAKETVGDINPAILNIHGGAIALGHPVGVSGARLILTTLKHMKRENLKYAVVSLCVGGGQGAAVVLER